MSDPSLSPERWDRVQEVFHAALAIPRTERSAYLDRLCGDDPALRSEVAALLEAHQEGGPVGTAETRSDRVLEDLRRALAGRYRVERQVATGGMALVFLAEDEKHHRKVAIKVLRPDLTVTIGAERFLREIEIAAGLQHPHILPLYDSGTAGNLLYYVMPYVEGDTLWDRLQREGALSEKAAVQVGIDMLSALEYAHRQGVVHRDVKPSNILLSSSGGHAVVADFGIARAVSVAGGGTLTFTGSLLGTPGYMAPEQAAATAVTPATDIYAVGIVLYECFTGRQWSGPAKPDEADWSGVPPRFQSVIRRALSWFPEERWKDAAAFRDALHDALGRSPRQRRGLMAAAVAGLTIVASVVGWLVLGRTSARPGPAGLGSAVAVMPFTVRGSSDFAYLAEGMVDLLSTKLDGAGNWRSVDPRAVLGTVSREGGGVLDLEGARRITERLGAQLFVLGTIVEVGGRLRFDAGLYAREARGNVLAQASAEGSAAEVLSMVDQMAAGLLAAQSEIAEARLTRIALVTTSSLPALKSYLTGIRELRAARFPEAAAAFESAVTADSTFALAWYQMSVTADWLLRADLARTAAEQAVRFSDRLAERDRRLLEALRAARQGEAGQAERLYRAIVGTYPEDIEAWSQLGETLFHFAPRRGRDLEESREPWNRVLRLEPDQVAAYVHLARIELSQRNVAALDSLAQRVITLVPSGDRTLEMRTFLAYTNPDRTARERIRTQLVGATDGLLSEIVWSMGSFSGDIDAAIDLARLLTATSRSVELRVYGHTLLAYLRLAGGQWHRAMTELDAAALLDPAVALEPRALLWLYPLRPADPDSLREYRRRIQRLDAGAVGPSATRDVWFSVHDGLHRHLRAYLLGLLSAALRDSAAAMSHGRALLALGQPPGSGTLIPDMWHSINATLERSAGRSERARSHVDQIRLDVWHQVATASPFYAQSYERYLRAMLFEEAGQMAEASQWYRSFRHTTIHDLIYLAPAHLQLGKMAEASGDLDAARLHYGRVLRLWADADPELQGVVREARDRLAGLENR